MKLINHLRAKLLVNLFEKIRRTPPTSRQEMLALQEKKLRRLLRYAYTHSPYYRETFQKAGITAENLHTLPLSAFPTIDKTELMENYEKILTGKPFSQEELRAFDESGNPGLFQKKYHVVHSSGSTGTPKYFVYKQKEWLQVQIRMLEATLLGLERDSLKDLFTNPRILYIAAAGSRFGGMMSVTSLSKLTGAQLRVLDVNEQLSAWMDVLQNDKPNVIIGYSTALKILADLINRTGITLDLKRIVSCGESLTPELRSYLESTFHQNVVNYYSATESLSLGVELDAREGMILFDDMNYLEVDGDKLYLTNLYNFSQPLIRYAISDSMRLVDRDGAYSSYSHAILMRGRLDDILWFTDPKGNQEFLHPTVLEDFSFLGLKDYQFRQISQNQFEVLVELLPGADAKQICAHLREGIDGVLARNQLSFVSYRLITDEPILSDPVTGKKRLTISLPTPDRKVTMA